MRYTVNHISSGEDELILNYRESSPEVEAVLLFMERHQRKLMGRWQGQGVIFAPEEILYVEKVDDRTFVYTKDREIQVDMSLSALELLFDDPAYFRCSKSMIVNVNKVDRLRSMSSNRIDVTLENGEHIVISRTYASQFRRLIKGDPA